MQRHSHIEEFEHTSDGDVDRHAEFLKLFIASYPRIHSLIVTLVGNASDADDAMQETSIVLWKKFEDFEAGTNFGRWAATVAHNVCRNFTRKRRRHRGIAMSEEIMSKLVQVHNGATELIELRRERLRTCVKSLSGNDRELLKVCYGDGMSVATLAKRIGQTKQALYVRLHRMRNRLHECVTRRLSQSGEDDQ